MKINVKWRGVLAAGLLTMMISPALAQENQESASQFLPEVLRQGDITYTSGGFGLEERDALKATTRNYNLIISNADKKGEFTSDTTIVITDKNNHQMLTVNDAGPLLYVKLPAGAYVVKGANGSENAVRNLAISGQKQERVHFIWSDQSISGK